MHDDREDESGQVPSAMRAAEADPVGVAETHGTTGKTRLSEMLRAIAADDSRERISIGDIITSMKTRAMGALLLLFALPNILPSIPGTSGITGLPLVYLTSQMMLGRLPWLPGFITNRSLAHRDFASVIRRTEPWLARTERLLKPRLSILVSERAERLIGVLALFLSTIILLPVPFGNSLPSLAICMFALGLMEKDGVWVIAGGVLSVASVLVVVVVMWALIKAALFIIMGAFG